MYALLAVWKVREIAIKGTLNSGTPLQMVPSPSASPWTGGTGHPAESLGLHQGLNLHLGKKPKP